MEWTKEQTLEFIELYRSRELLWNPLYPGYHDHTRRTATWTELSRILGRTVEELKRKTDNILSSLRRENMKIRKAYVQGKEFKTGWWAYDHLRFLMEKKKDKEHFYNMSYDAAVGTDQMERTDRGRHLRTEEIFLGEPAVGGATASNGSEISMTNNKEDEVPRMNYKEEETSCRTNSREDETMLEFEPSLQYLTESDDEAEFFGRWIAAKLKTFTAHKRSQLQAAITSVFAKATAEDTGSDMPPARKYFRTKTGSRATTRSGEGSGQGSPLPSPPLSVEISTPDSGSGDFVVKIEPNDT